MEGENEHGQVGMGGSLQGGLCLRALGVWRAPPVPTRTCGNRGGLLVVGPRKPLVRELKAVVMQEDGDSGTKVAALYEATQEREILPGEIRTS